MKARNFFALCILILFSKSLWAQEKSCATQLLLEEKKKSNPEFYKSIDSFKHVLTQNVLHKKSLKLASVEPTYVIPVVVHVIHNNPNPNNIGGLNNTNITDAQIYSQIAILNEDFRRKTGTNGFNNDPIGADVNIEFCLASSDPDGNLTNGITRTYNPKISWQYSMSDETLLKSLSYWPSDQYLNIWICNLANGFLGYAQFPSGSNLSGFSGFEGSALTDGVVIDYQSFGTGGAAKAPYNLGRTATHEIGHWLGLIHTWGDSNCGTDYVSDTPLDKGPNQDTDCSDSSNCADPAVYVQDMTNNYLDYSVDVCMNLFTLGQKDRMRAAMETAPRRMSLLSSRGCCASYTASVPLTEDFETTGTTKWSENSTNALVKWDTTTIGNESGYSILANNDNCNAGDSLRFISPFLNLTNKNAALKFDLAYAEDLTTGTDTLEISYSTNCVSWQSITKIYGSDLISTNTKTSDFTPSNNDWKTLHINLSALNNKIGRIKLENISNSRSKLYIDNISIYTTTPDLTINAFPNPTSDLLRLDISFENQQDITIEIYDSMGQRVFSETAYKAYAYTKELNARAFEKGIYIIKAYSGSQHKASKVVINY